MPGPVRTVVVMTTAVAPPASRALAARRAVLAVAAPRSWVALIHLVVDSLTALAITPPILLLMVVSAATIPIVPLAVLGFGLVLVLSVVEGRIVRATTGAVLGVHLPSPHTREPGTIWNRLVAHIRRGATWRELAFHLIHLPVSLVFVTLGVGVWAIGLALAALPFYVGSVPAERALLGPVTVESGPLAVAVGAVGFVLVLVAPWVCRGLSRVSLGITQGLLSRSEAALLRDRVGSLEVSRAGVVDAAEAERRRIERDLHDGAQQRLVSLAMTLGLAQEKIDTDPAAARELVDEAHREAKNALTELRDLARGLHPPVLTDRGLEAAVAGLASRCPVPVDVQVTLAERPPRAIEGIAYFLISETLTNVARHSGARRAYVLAYVRPNVQPIVPGYSQPNEATGAVVVEVGDDGRGGATTSGGTGLRGLAERVAAVDGAFAVTSPVGGPTIIRADLPLPPAARASTQEV